MWRERGTRRGGVRATCSTTPSPLDTTRRQRPSDGLTLRRQRHRAAAALDRAADRRGPALDADEARPGRRRRDDLDVWSSFASQSPVWQDDDRSRPGADGGRDRAHAVPDEPDGQSANTSAVAASPTSPPAEPSRITIGTDPSGIPRRPPRPTGRRRGASAAGRAGAARDRRRRRSRAATCRSRSPSALLIAAVFLAALMYKPWAWPADRRRHRPRRGRVLRQGVREGLPAGSRSPASSAASPRRSPPTGSATARFRCDRVRRSWPPSASFIGARSVEAGPMPNVARSPRSGSSGSACSARSRR